MAVFRNLSDETLIVGSPGGPVVEPDTTIEVEGDVVDETTDSYVVEMPNGEIRVWPKKTWSEATAFPVSKSTKPEKEE